MINRHTIILHAGGPGFGLPEISPYVMKTEVQLQMADLPYLKELTGFSRAPKGKIPYIDDEGTVADSTFIRAHLERKYGIDLDEGLTARERAEAWAIERMIEDHLDWTAVQARWLGPGNLEKRMAVLLGEEAPDDVREALEQDLRERIALSLHAQGMGRHSPEEMLALGVRSLSALSTLLGSKPYLMGDRPAGVDATAFGILAGIMTPFFDTAIRRKAEGFHNLVEYIDRMMQRHYPDHPWVPANATPRIFVDFAEAA